MKLSGAGRRKFWNLVKRDMPPDEALIVAKKPWSEIYNEGIAVRGNKLKRPIAEEESIEANNTESDASPTDSKKVFKADNFKIPKFQSGSTPSVKSENTANVQSDNTSNSQVAKPTPSTDDKAKMEAIPVVKIYNKSSMSHEQMNMVHTSLILEIGNCVTGKGPKFIDFIHKDGWILITCESNQSEEWLYKVIPHLKPWPEAELKTSLIDNALVATTFLPFSEAGDMPTVLHLLQVQNRGLHVYDWQLLSERKYKGGYVVIFSMDKFSIATLRKNNFKAAFGFKSIYFKMSPNFQSANVANDNKEENNKSVNETENPANNVVAEGEVIENGSNSKSEQEDQKDTVDLDQAEATETVDNSTPAQEEIIDKIIETSNSEKLDEALDKALDESPEDDFSGEL